MDVPTPRLAMIVMTLFVSLSSQGLCQSIVAHRGASADAPENTLAAFRLAWQQGADGIEGDFYLTADREIVCIHDANTRRTGGAKLDVEKSTLDQLRTLEYGSWKGAQWQGEPIPTLEQVIQTVPDGKLLVIELKSGPAIVPVLKQKLSQLDTSSIQILLICFEEATVAACRRQLPDIRTHWLTSFRRRTPFSAYRPTAGEVAKTVRRLGVDGVGIKGLTGLINKEFIEQLTDGGCGEFHVWTVDSPTDARRFAEWGAVGITTNRPAMIGQSLKVQMATH